MFKPPVMMKTDMPSRYRVWRLWLHGVGSVLDIVPSGLRRHGLQANMAALQHDFEALGSDIRTAMKQQDAPVSLPPDNVKYEE